MSKPMFIPTEKQLKKLSIEQKKEIAEKVMGCTVSVVHGIISGENRPTRYLEDFNPDQDLTQFVEMIEALEWRYMFRVDNVLAEGSQRYWDCAYGLQNLTWLCKHKYEVCLAVCEVVG